MVGTLLRKELIDAGAALIRKLDESGLQPDAAFWYYFPDAQVWKLVVVEVKVGKRGPKEIYRQIQRMLGKMKNEVTELSLDDLALAKPDSPLVTLLRTAVQTGSGIHGIRFSNNVVNGTVIEDAYIYRLN
ncbi:MAG TPA: hypothetical protein VGW36_08415 [Pyrinomonadaceae bacterium]|nr:hypothetical protein [Pyrinomonadaceae bacterium]